MKQIRKLMEEYNGTCYELDCQSSPTLINEILSPMSDFWSNATPSGKMDLNVTYKVKKEIVQSFLLTRRCSEELKLLKADMHAILSYWLKKIASIASAIAQFSVEDDLYSRGAIFYIS